MIDKNELPPGWTLATFEDLLDYIQPTEYIVESTEYNDNYKTPVLTAGKSFIKGYTNETKGIFNELPVIIFDDFTTATQFVNFPFKVKSSAMKILKPTCDLVNIKLAFYFMQTVHLKSETHKRYWISEYSKLPFPLPPHNEQKRIYDKIEEHFIILDKGIESLRTAQQQLKVYRQAVLKWAFEGKLSEDWRKKQKQLMNSAQLLKIIQAEKKKIASESGKNIKSLRPITDIERATLPQLPKEWSWEKLGNHAFVTKLAGFEFTKYVKYKSKGDVPVIRAQNVSRYSFIPRNFLYVDKEVMKKLPRSRVYGGEILMVFVGAGLGNVGIVPINQEYFLGPNVAKIALEKQFNTKFILHFLTSQLGFANVTGMTKATAQGSISMANIREVSVPLISIEEQNYIVNEIESRLSVCDNIEEAIENSLLQAEALRLSIIKKGFDGKLVKQNPREESAEILLAKIRAEIKKNIPDKPKKEIKVKKIKKKKELA